MFFRWHKGHHTTHNKGRSKFLEEQQGRKYWTIIIKLFMRLSILMVGFCLLLNACAPQSIIGVYKGKEGISSIILTLDSNHRFNYVWQEEMRVRKTQGHWTQTENMINLFSDSNMTSQNGQVLEKKLGLNNRIIQCYMDNCKNPYSGVEIIINDSIRRITDKNGEIQTNLPLRTLYIKFENNLYYYYTVKNSNVNQLIICLIPVTNEIYFSDQKYVLSGRTIKGKKGVKLKR